MNEKQKLNELIGSFEDRKHETRKMLREARNAGDGRSVAKYKDRVAELDKMIDNLEAQYEAM